jgi:glyoxylase-like metal-dependent hydrolase (beta-lactamase superfamily II)
MTTLYTLMGNTQRLDGGAMFGNVPRAVWSTWLKPDDQHRVPLACRCLLARDLNGKTVLFETGIGAFFAPKMRDRFGVVEAEHRLLEALNAIGLSHTDIDVVVLSHLHFDHAGGLLAAWQQDVAPALLFPNAEYIVSKACWQRALEPHARDRASFIPELQPLLAESGRLLLVDGPTCAVLGERVRFHYSDGHTPGLLLSEIMAADAAGGSLLFCADLIPGAAWVHLPVTMGYDRFPELLIDEKRRILGAGHARHMQLFFTHDPEVACAEIARRDEKFSATNPRPALHAVAF